MWRVRRIVRSLLGWILRQALAVLLVLAAVSWLTVDGTWADRAATVWGWVRQAPDTIDKVKREVRQVARELETVVNEIQTGKTVAVPNPRSSGQGTGEPSSRPSAPPADAPSFVQPALSPSEVTITTGDPWAAAQERRTLEEINRIRQEHGLKPLRWDDAVVPVARSRAREIFETQYVSSDHKLKRSGEPWEATARAGIPFSALGETIYLDGERQNVASRAAAGWYNSPPHREIMLHPDLDRVGIGIAYTGRPLRVYSNGQPYDFSAVVVAIYRREAAR
ncbi:MAG: CAP domain-containing protein [Firmicutes bacterium]|nr:CAP domain-containing protein [Bacillota bacterium]